MATRRENSEASTTGYLDNQQLSNLRQRGGGSEAVMEEPPAPRQLTDILKDMPTVSQVEAAIKELTEIKQCLAAEEKPSEYKTAGEILTTFAFALGGVAVEVFYILPNPEQGNEFEQGPDKLRRNKSNGLLVTIAFALSTFVLLTDVSLMRGRNPTTPVGHL